MNLAMERARIQDLLDTAKELGNEEKGKVAAADAAVVMMGYYLSGLFFLSVLLSFGDFQR